MKFFKSNNPIVNIIKGILISFLFTIIALIIYSTLLVYTSIPESTITPVILIITGIGILIGSSMGTKKIKKNGLLNGAIIGGAYILILYLLSSTINSNFTINLISLIMIIVRNNWWDFRTE